MDDVAGGDGVGGVDFSDEKQIRTWQAEQNVQARCVVASRIALRMLPEVKAPFPANSTLKLLRAILTPMAWASSRIDAQALLQKAADSASRSAASQANVLISRAHHAAIAAASASHAVAAQSGLIGCARAAYALHTRGNWNQSYSQIAIDRDINGNLENGFNATLWPENLISLKLEAEHIRFVEMLQADKLINTFWYDWYLAIWEGRFTDWDLAIEVAKIPDDVWEQGAEAVAAEIAKIKARRALEAEIASLKAQLRQAHAVEAPAHRLHNNPPEAIENDQQLRSEITLIWELLETVETEITKPAPSLASLRGIAERLWEVSLRISKYCASLADVALKKSAEVIGETGTKAGIAVFVTTTAAQNEGIKSVAHAIWEFVKTLPVG